MTNKNTLMILGFVLIGVGMIGLVPLYFYPVPSNNKDILSMGIGIILGWGSAAVTYYFGSSDR